MGLVARAQCCEECQARRVVIGNRDVFVVRNEYANFYTAKFVTGPHPDELWRPTQPSRHEGRCGPPPPSPVQSSSYVPLLRPLRSETPFVHPALTEALATPE